MWKLRFMVLLLFLAGCDSDNTNTAAQSAMNTTSATPQTPPSAESQPTSSVVWTESTAEPSNPYSVWDGLAERHPGEEKLLMDNNGIPVGPELFNLYLEGLSHPNLYVEWYSCYKIIEYGYHPDKQKAVDRLKALSESPDDNVKAAARFALDFFDRNFDGNPAFVQSPDGHKVAFHLYQEAVYNDGAVWIYQKDSDALNPFKGDWLSIDELAWSPDDKNLVIESNGRYYGEVDIINPETGESVLKKSVYDELMDRKLYTVVNNQRPDAYYKFVEWSPDSAKAMLSYSFSDDDNKVQQGIVIYDLKKATYTTVKPYPAGDDPYPDVQKPDGFTW